MQNENGESDIGRRISYLTPSKRPPPLLTRVTRAEKVVTDKLSPLFTSPTCVATSPSLSDLCQSLMQNVHCSNQNQMLPSSMSKFSKESKIKASKTDMELQCAPNLVPSSKGLKRNKERLFTHNEVAINTNEVLSSVENQIIPNERFFSGNVEETSPPPQSSGTLAPVRQGSSCTVSSAVQQTGTASISYSQRSHTMSVCSNSSADDSIDELSRNSYCDGCSCSNVSSCSTTALDRSSSCSLLSHTEENLSQLMEEILETSVYGVKNENRTLPSHRDSNDCSQHQKKTCLKNLSLSNDQMIFIILRLILSKYTTLMINIEKGEKCSHSQRLTIACLIQAVVVLAKRCRNSTQHYHKIQTDLKLLQMRYESLKKSQRKIYVIVCLLLMLNVLNLSPVKRRLLSCFRFFGIVETIKKINRTRKMIADNWRNIPLLLTDFWRIFIFRSNIRRNL